MIEILRQSDLTKITHYPKAIVDTIRDAVDTLDEEYGTTRTRDGDGGLELIVESEAELQGVIQSLPFGDKPESVDEIYQGYVRAMYLVNNDRTLDVFLPKEWATQAMKEELGE